jgi:hypothetical protein
VLPIANPINSINLINQSTNQPKKLNQPNQLCAFTALQSPAGNSHAIPSIQYRTSSIEDQRFNRIALACIDHSLGTSIVTVAV